MFCGIVSQFFFEETNERSIVINEERNKQNIEHFLAAQLEELDTDDYYYKKMELQVTYVYFYKNIQTLEQHLGATFVRPCIYAAHIKISTNLPDLLN